MKEAIHAVYIYIYIYIYQLMKNSELINNSLKDN